MRWADSGRRTQAMKLEGSLDGRSEEDWEFADLRDERIPERMAVPRFPG